MVGPSEHSRVSVIASTVGLAYVRQQGQGIGLMADREDDAVQVQRMRGRPVVALMMLAVALATATQIDAFAEIAFVLWLVSFVVVCVAFALAFRQWRATRK
jgi:hypothetical protein